MSEQPRKVKILIVDDQLTDGEREALMNVLKEFGADVEVESWPQVKHEVIDDIRRLHQKPPQPKWSPPKFLGRRGKRKS